MEPVLVVDGKAKEVVVDLDGWHDGMVVQCTWDDYEVLAGMAANGSLWPWSLHLVQMSDDFATFRAKSQV